MCDNNENLNNAPPEAETPENPAPAGELEAVKADLAAALEAKLRLAAEYDNFRKRTQKEKEAILGEATAMTVTAFLPVIDNLERAVSFADAEGLREGLELIMKQVSAVEEKLKLTQIDPAGQAFDPSLHNAVMHEEREDVSPNTVTEVLQKGYMLGDRVIRYAMVKVAN